MGIPVDQAAAAWALLTGDHARHEIEAANGALALVERVRCASGE
jgi:hypothetical protein